MDLEKLNGILHKNGMTYAQYQMLETMRKAWFVGERLVIKGEAKRE